MAAAAELKLRVGDKAPDFSVATDSGNLSLSDFKGRKVILYFYPKDNTPGCTKEACGFRDSFDSFEREGAVILGVSTDTEKSHKKFTEKFNLPFRLVPDPEKKIVRAYGVWGPKTFMGVKYKGTSRVTFLIGRDGRVEKIWHQVKASEHAAEVLSAVSSGEGQKA